MSSVQIQVPGSLLIKDVTPLAPVDEKGVSAVQIVSGLTENALVDALKGEAGTTLKADR